MADLREFYLNFQSKTKKKKQRNFKNKYCSYKRRLVRDNILHILYIKGIQLLSIGPERRVWPM